MTTTYIVYAIDEAGNSVYLCETTDEDRAADEVDRLNYWASMAGRPATAYYV